MNHLIWPEGLPNESYATTNGFKAFFKLGALQIKQLLKFSGARRMRHATGQGNLDAHKIELSMKNSGATPPPGGWPESKAKDTSGIPADLHVRTHSVV